MSRFRWLPFDANEWRDVSDLLSENERGVYVELIAVYWISQPAERIAFSPEEWARRLRLHGAVARSIRGVFAKLREQGLIDLSDEDERLCVSIPSLATEYRRRAKDSDRHGRKIPGTVDGKFQALASEGSGGQDKTEQDKTEKTGQDNEDNAASAAESGKSEEVDAIIAHYRSYHPHARPGKRERKLIAERLAEGYSPADLCQAIDGCHVSPHHCGRNETGTKYQNLELIVRDSTHVAQFVEVFKAPGMPQSANQAAGARFLARFGLSLDGKDVPDGAR